MKLFKNKKAMEVQFNWIFVLIVGGLILLLFIGFIGRQQQASQVKLSSQVLSDLDAVFTGAGVSAGAAELIQIPNLPIEFQCDQYAISNTKKPISKAIPIFSPSSIQSTEMVLWAKEWSVPYKITNFLYITSPNIRYILIGETGFADQVFDNLPPKRITQDDEEKPAMGKERVMPGDISGINNQNSYKVRLIFFNDVEPQLPEGLKGVKDSDITALHIKGAGQDQFQSGSLGFYDKKGDGLELIAESAYLGEASLFGAIFSENIDDYNCIMSKAFLKYKAVTQIYLNRIKEVYASYQMFDPSNPCVVNYMTDQPALQNPIESILSIVTNGFEPGAVSYLTSPIEALGSLNQNTVIGSCVTIY